MTASTGRIRWALSVLRPAPPRRSGAEAVVVSERCAHRRPARFATLHHRRDRRDGAWEVRATYACADGCVAVEACEDRPARVVDSRSRPLLIFKVFEE